MPLSKSSLERLIEASPDIVVATDAGGTVAYYNDGAQEILGYSRDEIIGQYVARLYPSLEEARRVMTAMRDEKTAGSDRVVNFPTRFVAKDGHEIPVAISGVILHDTAHQERGTIGFAKDLSEIIRKDKLATLGEVAIGLSHEINNPLAVILNQVALIENLVSGMPESAERTLARKRFGLIQDEIDRIEVHLRRLYQMAQGERYESTRYLGDAQMIDLSTAPEAGERSLRGKRILVVDDDGAVRESVADVLRAQGCVVDSAADGHEALAWLKTCECDVVLSDVVMPSMDGYELFRQVRQHYPGTHIVLMTAFYYDRDHVLKRSRLEGLEAVLFKKPVDPERLCQTLAMLLRPPPRDPSSR